MGSRRDCTWILGLTGFRVLTMESDGEGVDSRLTIRVERRGLRRYVCGGCGGRTGRVRSTRDRTWDDVPWASHPVTLVYTQRRLYCRHCGIRTERMDFADPKARSRDACASRSDSIANRCRPVMRPCATASAGARFDGPRRRFSPTGIARGGSIARAIWAPMKSSAGRGSSSGRSSRISSAARSSGWRRTGAKRVCGPS
ncbi:MAG: transposase family protein [Acidobacteria bacterium]|nr:transposase family protein [Acidobacteriota bacterium]